MKEDTLPKTVLETILNPIRRRETREDITIMLQRMMNLPQRESNKKVMILQVMKICSDFRSHGNYHTGRNDWLIDDGASKHK